MQDNGNAMTGAEHREMAEELLERVNARGFGDGSYSADLIAMAQVHATLARIADKAPAEDLGEALVEAHKVADRIMFEIDEGAAPSERHCVDMWHGLTVKGGRGATPAEALGVAYAKLTAYLADAS